MASRQQRHRKLLHSKLRPEQLWNGRDRPRAEEGYVCLAQRAPRPQAAASGVAVVFKIE